MSASHHSLGDEPSFGLALPALYNVVYCSRATADVDDAEVARIITTARRCNPEHGITGMLVFGSGIFFQWLEGPRDNVTALMSLLRTDRRHESIILLSETEEVRERLFPEHCNTSSCSTCRRTHTKATTWPTIPSTSRSATR